MENSTEVSLKIRNRATIRSSNPTPGHISGENHNSKRCMHLSVHCSTIYNSQDEKNCNFNYFSNIRWGQSAVETPVAY